MKYFVLVIVLIYSSITIHLKQVIQSLLNMWKLNPCSLTLILFMCSGAVI